MTEKAQRIDLRYTYVCAHCGKFATLSFWAIEVFDTRTLLICDKCGEQTVLMLVKPNEYTSLAEYKTARKFFVESADLKAGFIFWTERERALIDD